MKTSTGFTGVLAFLAIVDVASARASARASVSSSGGILRDSSPKQYDGLAIPQIDAKLGVPAELGGEAAKAAVAVTGGQEVQERRTRVGVMGVLGGALCHLVLGTTYCWGNFVPYVPSKLKCFGDSPGCSDASYVLPGAFVAQMLTMPLGPYFQAKIGCQATTAMGCAIMALGVFLSSFAPNLATFMFCYSFLFGAGGFVFNQVGTSIINPKGLNAVGGVYPDEVYANFPVMLRKLALIYVVVAGIGALFIKDPPAPASNGKGDAGKVEAAKGATLGEAVRDQKFWIMWFMVLMIGTSGINVANCYKQYGNTVDALKSDQFQSLVGSVAALCNGGGRLFWGNMLDVFGFKKMFCSLAAIQSTTTALYTVLSQSKAGYLFGTGVLLFCLGGNFAMFPALTSKVFGGLNGAKIYGVLFSAFALASISGTFLTKNLMTLLGWEWEQVFKLMAFLSICAIAALPVFDV